MRAKNFGFPDFAVFIAIHNLPEPASSTVLRRYSFHVLFFESRGQGVGCLCGVGQRPRHASPAAVEAGVGECVAARWRVVSCDVKSTWCCDSSLSFRAARSFVKQRSKACSARGPFPPSLQPRKPLGTSATSFSETTAALPRAKRCEIIARSMRST